MIGGIRRTNVSLEYAWAHEAAALLRWRMKLVIQPTNLLGGVCRFWRRI
jgi:hypothetical protein